MCAWKINILNFFREGINIIWWYIAPLVPFWDSGSGFSRILELFRFHYGGTFLGGWSGCLSTKWHQNCRSARGTCPLKTPQVSSTLDQRAQFYGPLKKVPPATKLQGCGLGGKTALKKVPPPQRVSWLRVAFPGPDKTRASLEMASPDWVRLVPIKNCLPIAWKEKQAWDP